MNFDKEYYLNFGHHNDNIGTVARHVELIKTKQRVLVVPCGYGQIMNYLLAEGIDCVGYDVNVFLIQIAQKHLHGKIFLNDIRTMKKAAKPFDLIICTDVLEHLTEDEIDASLKNMIDNMLPGGHVLMRVGTEELDVFDGDPTHKTKKSIHWWMEKFAQFGLYLYYGFTASGEMVLTKTDPKADIEHIFKINTRPSPVLDYGQIVGASKEFIFIDQKYDKYAATEHYIDKNNQRHYAIEPFDRIAFGHKSIYMLANKKLVGAVCVVGNCVRYPCRIIG